MKRLLTITIVAFAIFMTQPAQAQQQDAKNESMEMMQDSTMMKKMMQKMMENPQMHKKMMQNMKSDSTMSGMQGMKGGGMCMKMCMNMMDNMKEGKHMDMHDMREDKNSDSSGTKMKDSEY